MTHDEMIAVIQAHKEGKKIQTRSVAQPNVVSALHAAWRDVDCPYWNFRHWEYRVKVEPRRVWVSSYGNMVTDKKYLLGSDHDHWTEFVEIIK